MNIETISNELNTHKLLLANAKTEEQARPILISLLRTLANIVFFDVAFISRFEGGRRVIEYLNNDNEAIDLVAGYSDLIENSLCLRAASGRVSDVIFDTSHLPSNEYVEVIDTFNISSYLCVPIIIDQIGVYGTIGLIGHKPNWDITEEQIKTVESVAQLFAFWKKDQITRREQNSSAHKIVNKVINNSQFELYYQPIFDIQKSRAIGFECLTRFFDAESNNTECMFNNARGVKLTTELELKIMKTALVSLDYFGEYQFLSVNLSHETLLSEKLNELLNNITLNRLVIEINDDINASSYIQICKKLNTFLSKGLRICLEDRSLSLIRQGRQNYIDPDVLKLTFDNFKKNESCELLKWRLNFIHSLSESSAVRLVVQHVEKDEQLNTLIKNGIRFAQGFHLGKPESLIKATYEYS
ncbi:MAG: hypothetical protein CTY33_01895 [Methylotenera sp.]|nr:MAG: hypothetical protein CTY33_01895 [Methylotenera sp.]